MGLRYMHGSGGSWAKETVDPNSVIALQVGRGGTSIEIDSQDRPHISYDTFPDTFGGNTGRPGGLRYATQLVDGSWNIQIVDQVGRWVGTGPSLKLDAYDAPHILYRIENLHDEFDDIPGPNGADLRYAEPVLATVLGAAS